LGRPALGDRWPVHRIQGADRGLPVVRGAVARGGGSLGAALPGLHRLAVGRVARGPDVTRPVMSHSSLRAALKSQYHASLAMLREAVELCPAEEWTSDAHTNAFWQVAYHALYFTHLY